MTLAHSKFNRGVPIGVGKPSSTFMREDVEGYVSVLRISEKNVCFADGWILRPRGFLLFSIG